MNIQQPVVGISVDKQKQAIEIKYLLETADDSNQDQLCKIINNIYPFTSYPLDHAPPLELIQAKQKKPFGKNIGNQLQKYSFIVITGGINIKRRRHEHVENRLLSLDSQEDLFFSLKDPEIEFMLLPNSCILKVHTIWIEMAKKKKKVETEKYISQKLMKIAFFANLSFEEFSKCCKTAQIITLGPNDVLLKSGETPYHLYIVAEGELVFQKRVTFYRDTELWSQFKNELQREQDDTCQKMLDYLAKQPRQYQQRFQVDFKIKNISEGQIICARQTLLEEKLSYSIISTLKTKLITLKYPDLYNLQSQRLSEIRGWPLFQIDDKKLRRDYFYQAMWSQFKEETKQESKLNKLQKKKFEDFLRKNMSMNPEKHYYVANRVGEGVIIDSPAGKVSKLKQMSYKAIK